MSGLSKDEFSIQNDIDLTNKKINHYSHGEYYRENQESDEEQDYQSRIITACMMGYIPVIDEYISYHDINDFLYSGWTMLLYASFATMPEVVEYLLKSGADPNKHRDGYTPLMAVCDSTRGTMELCLQCIAVLLDAKANINATNKDRRTALMYACKSRTPEVVAELLKHVSDIELTDSDGRTAIFYAVGSNKIENVKVLMKHKASTSVVDRYGLTPSNIALEKNFEQILQLLSFEHEDIDDYCPTLRVLKWQDTLPNSNSDLSSDSVDENIGNILYALALDNYRRNFIKMNLKTFLQLTEDDLINLGMDIQLHRKKFIAGLLKFHVAKWKPQSIRLIDKSMPYKMFDGVTSLLNVVRQITVIGSSFQFVKNNLVESGENEIKFNNTEKDTIEKYLKETKITLLSLRNDFQRILNFAQKIEKEDRNISSLMYIGPNKRKKSNSQWLVIISVTLMTGMFLSKILHVQKLFNY